MLIFLFTPSASRPSCNHGKEINVHLCKPLGHFGTLFSNHFTQLLSQPLVGSEEFISIRMKEVFISLPGLDRYKLQRNWMFPHENVHG